MHRSSRKDSGSSSAGKRGWQYILIDIERPLNGFCRFWEGWRFDYLRIGRGWGRGGRCSIKLSRSVASRIVHSGWARGGWERCSFHSSTGPLQSPRPSGAPGQAWSPAPLLTQAQRSTVWAQKAAFQVTKCITRKGFTCLPLRAAIKHGCHSTGKHSNLVQVQFGCWLDTGIYKGKKVSLLVFMPVELWMDLTQTKVIKDLSFWSKIRLESKRKEKTLTVLNPLERLLSQYSLSLFPGLGGTTGPGWMLA